MSNTESALIEIEDLRQIAFSDLDNVTNSDDLESWRINYLGRNGKLSSLMKVLTTITNEEKRLVGPKINELKVILNQKFSDRKNKLIQNLTPNDNFDNSLPGLLLEMGNYHPTTLIIREICNAFGSMGFEILEGKEIETEKYNFDLLNIPSDHPARDQWDTIWLNASTNGEKHLLRTHTSPMQARIMERKDPPIRVVVLVNAIGMKQQTQLMSGNFIKLKV